MIELVISEFDLGVALTIGLVFLISTIVVRVAGFGGALIAMPIISPFLGIGAAASLMNLNGVTTASTLVVQKWRELKFDDMWRVALMNVMFTPIGISVLRLADESILRIVLGIVCAGYALIRLLDVPAPSLENPNWGWVYGVFSGLFTGAFSVGGLPAVLYADTQDWEPERFRVNMFSFFAVTGIINLATRYIAGQITLTVVMLWLITIPSLFVGLWAGEKLTNYVDKNRFQKLVLVMLVILGGRLIYSAF